MMGGQPLRGARRGLGSQVWVRVRPWSGAGEAVIGSRPLEWSESGEGGSKVLTRLRSLGGGEICAKRGDCSCVRLGVLAGN